MKRARLVVTIDEVRLYGFNPRARAALGDALASELTRLFGESGATPRSRHVARVDAGTFPAPRNASPQALGANLAARVHRTVNKPC